MLDLRPKDTINPKPFTIEASVLAAETMEIVENRERPLNVVPVVDEK